MLMLNLSDVKLTMKKLLFETETDFDAFLLSEAVIKMGNTFTIDGHINSDFYSADEIELLQAKARENGQEYDESLVRWGIIKSHALSIIKGHKTPNSFGIVLYLSKENTQRFVSGLGLPEGAMQPGGLMLNLKYDGSELHAITGTVYPGFNPDKTIDREWDMMVKKFFTSINVPYEELS